MAEFSRRRGAYKSRLCGDRGRSIEEILKFDHLCKASEQYFSVVLFIMLYKVVLSFKSVDEFLKCDLSNESY